MSDATPTNPLVELAELGQSVWLDDLDRTHIASGELRRHISVDRLRGMTTNPSIFEKSITGGSSYDVAIRALAARGLTPVEIYEAIALEDVRLAADAFRPMYERLEGRDGFVSLEVSPHLAYDTRATVEEAIRLARAVDRPNVMIKVPGTRQGVPAIEELVAEGIAINVTLLFAIERYEQVVEAFIAGLEARARRGLAVDRPSVASFFLSRIDGAVDKELDARVRARRVPTDVAHALRGQVAIASARVAYQRSKELFATPRFATLASLGARRQRLLWASTSTKDPAYDDLYYVEALIGEGTIDTVPRATFGAYRDHGRPAARLETGLPRARAVLAELPATGIDLEAITHHLEREGVRKFADAYDHLLAVIASRK